MSIGIPPWFCISCSIGQPNFPKGAFCLNNYSRRVNLIRQRVQISDNQVPHGGFKRFVTEHVLNRAYGNLLRFPVAGASLAEPVQVMVLAYGMGLARNRDFSGWMPALSPRGCTVSAIQFRAHCYTL
jgi:hypothetical protein